jgi:hypothetical protein
MRLGCSTAGDLLSSSPSIFGFCGFVQMSIFVLSSVEAIFRFVPLNRAAGFVFGSSVMF